MPSEKARELFEIARTCFHYAPRGTSDGGMFEASETGRLLMNAMEKIATLEQPLSETVGEGEPERLAHVIDRDRYIVAAALQDINGVLHSYSHLAEPGRGSYPWDDDRYQAEFGNALEALGKALVPLSRMAADKSDCTTDPEKVVAARKAGVEAYAALAASHPPEQVKLPTREALETIQADCQHAIDFYERNGPSFTSPAGDEYEPTSFVQEKMREIVAVCAAALLHPVEPQPIQPKEAGRG